MTLAPPGECLVGSMAEIAIDRDAPNSATVVKRNVDLVAMTVAADEGEVIGRFVQAPDEAGGSVEQE